MNYHVIIVAGGSGQRMGSALPKQFLRLGNRPVLMHTLEKFREALPEANLLLVLPEDHHETWNQLVKKHQFLVEHHLCQGGATRFHSVKNGLHHIHDGIVGVHDGVRPLVSVETIKRCFSGAASAGNAVPVVPAVESLRMLQAEGASLAVKRSDFVLVQTPQCFQTEAMKLAFEQEYQDHFTDCASVMEAAGHHIHLVEGNPENIKITNPMDLVFAESYLGKSI